MSVHQPAALFEQAIRHAEMPARRNRGERTFELHPAVHFMVVGTYVTFAAILCTAFMGKDLIVPAAIVFIGIASLFVTPGLWARVKPDDGLRKQSWSEFMSEGVECITGRLTGVQALAQILVLPTLMVGLALVFAIIKATL
ncbi:MAG TPA: hypothetical protein VGD10_11485 [Allosphingosinicella sp.]|uniref:hypothetical protein n=1 Tax=Allosphingosinicella sp. TaxID=2823234 RepID=UPI002EDB704C